MGKRKRSARWASPCQDDRVSKKRTFTLSPEVHERLNKEAEEGSNLSANCDAALRAWYDIKDG
jgi:hypothetical protein